MRGNGIFNTVTQICATKVCYKLFLQGSLFVGRLCNKLLWLFYCDFTTRLFVSVQNHIYFIGFLSFHCTIFCIFSKLQLCSVGFLSFHATVFLFKITIIFYLVFVCRFTALFCLFNICAVQNNVKYNKYSLLMMNCQTKCNTQKKVVE